MATDFKIIMWDVLSYDYNTSIKPEKVLSNITLNATNGSIVVMHDSLKAEKNLHYVLPKILNHYTERGFSFRAIS